MKFTKLTLVAMLLALLVCAFVACGAPVETQGETEGNTPVVTDPVETEPTVTEPVETECQHVNVIEEIDEPTCESRGYTRTKCADCGDQVSVKPIDAIDHVEAAPATCTEGSVCKFCGVAMNPATGHLIGEVTDFKEATATESGYKKGKCISCGVEVTEEIPAGLTEDFNSYNEGQLSADDMMSAGNIPGFTVEFGSNGKPESYQIVSEGGNKILSRAADQGATITLVDNEGKLASGKFAISFDYRADSATASTGILSFKDNNGVEHRLISAWAGDLIRVCKNNGVVLIEGIRPEDKTWYNIRVVVDPSTYDYEFYINGKKIMYTTPYDSVSGKHLIWTQEVESRVSAPAGKNYNDTSCFGDPASGVASIYMFHFGKVACSIDNLRLEYFSN